MGAPVLGSTVLGTVLGAPATAGTGRGTTGGNGGGRIDAARPTVPPGSPLPPAGDPPVDRR